MIVQLFGILLLFTSLGIIIHYIRVYGIDRIILFLTLVFSSLILLVAFPYIFRDQIQLGFIRPLDAFLTITSVAALLTSMALYLRLRKTEQDLTKIVRDFALQEK